MVVSAVVNYFNGRDNSGSFVGVVASVVDYDAGRGRYARLVGAVFGTGAYAIYGGG